MLRAAKANDSHWSGGSLAEDFALNESTFSDVYSPPTRYLMVKPRESGALQILQALEAKSGVAQRELAQRLDLSLSRTNYVLRALVRKGLVKVENFRSRWFDDHINVIWPARAEHVSCGAWLLALVILAVCGVLRSRERRNLG